MAPIRVLLADDHPLVRCGIRKLLDTATGIVVVGEVCDGLAALEQTIELQPDVLVLDVEMPGMRGDEVARRLREIRFPVRILLLSVYNNAQQINELLASGVDGYVAKHEAVETILQAIHSVMAQEPRSHSSDLSTHTPRALEVGRKRHPSLTDREAEVLDLVVLGRSDAEIARKLKITERTVRYHLHNIYRKLNVSRRCEAIVWAMGEDPGLISP